MPCTRNGGGMAGTRSPSTSRVSQSSVLSSVLKPVHPREATAAAAAATFARGNEHSTPLDGTNDGQARLIGQRRAHVDSALARGRSWQPLS